MRGDSVPQGTLGDGWGHLSMSRLEVGRCSWHGVGGGRGAAQHLTVPRTAPHRMIQLKDINSAETEKPVISKKKINTPM